MFKGGEQQDAHELLRFLLDGLQDELKDRGGHDEAGEAKSTKKQWCADPVEKLFAGKLRSSVVCQQCLSVLTLQCALNRIHRSFWAGEQRGRAILGPIPAHPMCRSRCCSS